MRQLTALTLVCLLTIALSPSAAAASYTATDTITPLFATPTWSDTVEYTVDLNAGETIEATLAWADPNTDLDLTIIAPGGSCEIFPNPDVMCIAGLAVNPTCQGSTYTGGLGPASESTGTITAATAGTYTVVVQAATGLPTVPVSYDIDIQTSGSNAISGPDATSYIRSSGHCRL